MKLQTLNPTLKMDKLEYSNDNKIKTSREILREKVKEREVITLIESEREKRVNVGVVLFFQYLCAKVS